MPALPIINLRSAALGSPTRPLVAKQLVEALEKIGFFYVTGIRNFNEKRIFNKCKWFFSLPKDEKMLLAKHQHKQENKNFYKGYFPADPKLVIHSEGFEVVDEPPDKTGLPGHEMFYEPNVWPEGRKMSSEFKEDILEYYTLMQGVGYELMCLTAEGVGLNTDYWESIRNPWPLSTLRMLRYPQRTKAPPPEAIDGDNVLQCEEHTDSGLFTLLCNFGFKGLQVREKGGCDGQWMDVHPIPDHLVVNIGDTMSEMSGGRFISTKHRVLDKGVERFSLPFFFKPGYSADISPRPELLKDEKTKKEFTKMTYGDYLIEKMLFYDEEKPLIHLIYPNKDFSNSIATPTETRNLLE